MPLMRPQLINQPASYSITTDGTTYYENDELTGATIFSSTNFDSVVTDLSARIGTGTSPTKPNVLIEFGPGSYTTLTGINFDRGNITFKGAGMGITIIQLSASAADNVLLWTNSANTTNNPLTPLNTLAANANVGDLTITLSAGRVAAQPFLAGDYIRLREDGTTIDPENVTRMKGELHQIISVAGDVITISDTNRGGSIYETFLVANTATVDRLPKFYENVKFQDMTFTDLATTRDGAGGNLTTGQINMNCIRNLTFQNCGVTNLWFSGFTIADCWSSKVVGCDVYQVNKTTNQNSGYGVEVRGSSLNTTITGNTFNRCRHSVTTGAATKYFIYGRNRGVAITSNVSTSTWTSHFDSHNGAEQVSFIGNTCVGGNQATENGIQTRSPAVIIGNTIVGMNGSGITCDYNSGDTIIQGNQIKNCTNGVTLNSTTTANYQINNNTFVGCTGTVISMVGACANSQINNNAFRANAAICINASGVITGSQFNNNYFNGGTIAISLGVTTTMTDITIIGNTITGMTGSSNLINLRGAAGPIHCGDNTLISGNKWYGNSSTGACIKIDSCTAVNILSNYITHANVWITLANTGQNSTSIMVMNNVFDGGGSLTGFVTTSAHMIINNSGFNLKGHGATAITTPWGNTSSANDVLPFTGTNANPTSANVYTFRECPMLLEFSAVGGATAASFNGIVDPLTLAQSLGTYQMNPGDTFSITWTVTPPTIVIRPV